MSKKPRPNKLFCTTVKLPEDLHRQFRIYALKRGQTMQATMAEIIRKTLGLMS